MAFVRMVRFRLMCPGMSVQAAARETPRAGRQERAIDAPGSAGV
jgi:hypothetical protein